CRVLLFVDQLEEVFTLVREEEDRRLFVEAVFNAADDPTGPVRVVLTIRDDFLGRVLEGAEVSSTALDRVVVLRRPSPAALETMLTRPLEVVGYRYDDARLATEIVAAVKGEPACLPLLEFAAGQLWDRRDGARRLVPRAAYEAMGGIAGALAEHADGVLQGLSSRQVRVARELLLGLVTAEGTRRAAAKREIVGNLGPDGELVLGRLVQARLVNLRKGEEESDANAVVELAHESLIRTWGRLARWLEESREEMAFLAQALQAAELWEKRGRRHSELWQGEALAEARRGLGKCQGPVPGLVLDFLATAEEKARTRRRSMRLLVLSAASVLVVIAAASVLVARDSQRQRDRAEKERRRAELQRAEAQREGARAALARGELLEARAKLRGSFEAHDSLHGRALWWRLEREPMVWRKELASLISDVAFSPDGSMVAVAGQERSVYLFDTRTLAMRLLRGHEGRVMTVAFSPDGRRVASGTESAQLGIWDLKTGTASIWTGNGALYDVAFSPNGRLLGVASYDRTVSLWDTNAGSPAKTLTGHTAPVRSISFQPDGREVASGSADGSARVWDIASGTARHVLAVGGLVRSVAYNPHGSLLATGDSEGKIQLWSTANGRNVTRLSEHQDAVARVVFHPDGRRLLSAGHDKTVRLWDINVGVNEQTYRGHEQEVITVAVSPDGRLFASGSYDRTLRLWRIQPDVAVAEHAGHTNSVQGIAFHPDGQLLASVSADQTVRLWDVWSGEEKQVLEGHTGWVEGVAFSPDGRLLATASADRTVRAWSLTQPVKHRLLPGHDGPVMALAFSPDGQVLASSGHDMSIRLTDVASGSASRVLTGHTGSVYGLAFSHSGRYLATGGWDSTIRLWDLEHGGRSTVLVGHTGVVAGLSFRPDDRVLVSSGSDGTLRIWDLAANPGRAIEASRAIVGRIVRQHRKGLMYAAFHPDGRRIGVPLADGAYVLDTASGQVSPLRGSRGMINYMKFSPDGRLAATSGNDGTVRLWIVETGEPYWRAPALLADPPRLISHQGTRRLLDVSETALTKNPQWQTALEDRAVLAAETVATSSSEPAAVCMTTRADRLERWDKTEDRLQFDAATPAADRLLAVSGGCVTLTRDRQAQFFDHAGSARTLAANTSAIAADGESILVAAGRTILTFTADTAVATQSFSTDPGVSALTRSGDWLVLGWNDGQIQLVPATTSEPGPSFAFEGAPSSPVLRLLEGPMNTLFAGYTSGFLGMWSLENGAQLESTKLHGPVVHLMLENDTLFAATELGQVMTWKLDVFHQSACGLLRQVWQKVPVVWQGGLPVLRPPPADHQCAGEGNARTG
ncbi:MAG: WD40 repeat domain-containing protein, partial [Pseudomonadota bacterium]